VNVSNNFYVERVEISPAFKSSFQCVPYFIIYQFLFSISYANMSTENLKMGNTKDCVPIFKSQRNERKSSLQKSDLFSLVSTFLQSPF